jgi:hypothetical protein
MRRHATRTAALCFALCIALLGGCSMKMAPPAADVVLGRGGRVVVIPGVRERLQFIALQEWTLWGRATLNASTDTLDDIAGSPRRQEHDPEFTSRVLLYWFTLRGSDFPAGQALLADGSLQPWSAVFISFLMRSAGIGRDLFHASPRHWDYIKRIHDAPNPAGFEALDAATTAPGIGDVICAPRAYTAEALRRFEQLAGEAGRGTWHCDLVVSVKEGSLGAIGGNVRDGVTWTNVQLDPAGRVLPSQGRPWIVVLRNNLP